MVAVDEPAEIVLTPSQVDAVRAVQSVWPDTPVILIGATALAQHVPIDRVTDDIDFAVAVSNESFGDDLAGLPGWRRHPKMEHRFFSPDNQMLDVLPASTALIQQGHVEWSSGVRMSLIGFDLAFANTTERSIQTTPPLRIALPSAPAIAFLKMRAWLDRPNERAKDLQDLALLFERYVDDDRRWSDEGIDVGGRMDYEDVSPFMLGSDLARIVSDEHRDHVDEFLQMVQPTALARRKSVFGEEDVRAHAAFARGFRAGIWDGM